MPLRCTFGARLTIDKAHTISFIKPKYVFHAHIKTSYYSILIFYVYVCTSNLMIKLEQTKVWICYIFLLSTLNSNGFLISWNLFSCWKKTCSECLLVSLLRFYFSQKRALGKISRISTSNIPDRIVPDPFENDFKVGWRGYFRHRSFQITSGFLRKRQQHCMHKTCT